MLQQLLSGHAHVTDGLFGNDILAEDCHLDLLVGSPLILPESQALLAGVVQQTDGVPRAAAVIEVGDHIHLHVVVARFGEVELKMSLKQRTRQL